MNPVEKWRNGVAAIEHYEAKQGEDITSEEARGPLYKQGVGTESEDAGPLRRGSHAREPASPINSIRIKGREVERVRNEGGSPIEQALQAKERGEVSPEVKELLGGELMERELKARERKRGSWQGDAEVYKAKEQEAREHEEHERKALERQLKEREAEERAQREALEREAQSKSEAASEQTQSPREDRTKRGSYHTREGASGSGSYDSNPDEDDDEDEDDDGDSSTKREEDGNGSGDTSSDVKPLGGADWAAEPTGMVIPIKVPRGNTPPASITQHSNGRKHHQDARNLQGLEEGQPAAGTSPKSPRAVGAGGSWPALDSQPGTSPKSPRTTDAWGKRDGQPGTSPKSPRTAGTEGAWGNRRVNGDW